MQVKDPELIKALMKARGLSARGLSAQVGWKSHSYANRLLAGQVRTIAPDAAAHIARLLHVSPDVLFTTRESSETGQTVRRGRKGRAA